MENNDDNDTDLHCLVQVDKTVVRVPSMISIILEPKPNLLKVYLRIRPTKGSSKDGSSEKRSSTIEVIQKPTHAEGLTRHTVSR